MSGRWPSSPGSPASSTAWGLACLDQVLRDEGWSVANLGPDVPPADLALFLARNHADLLALSASLAERVPAVGDAIAADRAARPDAPMAIMLGGALVAEPGVTGRLDEDFVAPSLVEAARFARIVADALPEDDPERVLTEPGSTG